VRGVLVTLIDFLLVAISKKEIDGGRRTLGPDKPLPEECSLRKKMKSIFVTIVILLNTVPVTQADGYDLLQFIGPQVGGDNYYRGNDGSKMRLSGISLSSNGDLIVEEVFIYPEEFTMFDMENKQKKTYKLFLADDKIIKQKGDKQEVVLQISETNPTWLIKGKQLTKKDDRIKSKEINIKCEIGDMNKEMVLGRSILVATKKCEYEENDTTFITIEKYGSGIGLVEKTHKMIENKGEIKTLYKIQLYDIKR
jgi:hypothetical protein